MVVDRQHTGEGLLGLEFICYGPARGLRSEAQRALEGHFVDLDDYAVGGEGECFAGRIPFADICLDLLYAVADASLVRDGEAPAFCGPQGLVVGLEGQAFARDVIEGAPQTAVSDFLGIEELQRTGGGITRIGEGSLFLEDALAVEPVESLVRHQYFAPDLELGGIVPMQLLRDVGDAPDVFGDIVADHAVTSCQCTE